MLEFYRVSKFLCPNLKQISAQFILYRSILNIIYMYKKRSTLRILMIIMVALLKGFSVFIHEETIVMLK